ncbi:hypothetical protein ILYODFUR_004604 [Ilyodon furcidens]|uniref:Uncharacterized protein n=1 Tax=Ilyodon furcidens TaxID=33524 RepID=A0ABV0U2N7_9TELE
MGRDWSKISKSQLSKVQIFTKQTKAKYIAIQGGNRKHHQTRDLENYLKKKTTKCLYLFLAEKISTPVKGYRKPCDILSRTPVRWTERTLTGLRLCDQHKGREKRYLIRK